LKAKGDSFEKFKQYKALVDNKIGHKIKVLRSDNGGEFVSKKFDTFLAECEIQQETIAPYSPQQNDVVEHANGTIMKCARSMNLAQGFDLEFWGEVVNTTVYIKNQCPTKPLDSKTPQKAWSDRKPDCFI
jgi:transposase InsO family protein